MNIMIAIIAVLMFFYITTHTAQTTGLYENSTEMKLATASDYDNCIILEKDMAVEIIDKKKISIAYNNMKSTITKDEKKLQTKQINIIFTKEASYDKIVKTINIMSQLNIHKYKLLRG